jgi:hypothetical protein
MKMRLLDIVLNRQATLKKKQLNTKSQSLLQKATLKLLG